jgi:multiple sugar transport system ATP-binding protein
VITQETKAATTAEEGEDIISLTAVGGKTPFTARVDARTGGRPGGLVRLSLDPRRVHFFNPQTGLAIGAPDRASTPA